MNSDIIFWILVGITALLFLGVLAMLFKHNRLISRFPADTQTIANEIRGIGFYVRIIAYIAIVICLFISLHYLCVHYARIIPFKGTGADYLGVIVAILAIIVTLLVGWQIFSTIKAKEELRQARQDVENRFADRLIELDKCCKNGRSELEKLKDKVENFSNKQSKTDGVEEAKEEIKKVIDLSFPKEILERIDFDIAKKGTKLYSWLWAIIDETKTDGQILDEYRKVKNKSPQKVSFINGRVATDAEVVALMNDVRPVKIMFLKAIKGASE